MGIKRRTGKTKMRLHMQWNRLERMPQIVFSSHGKKPILRVRVKSSDDMVGMGSSEVKLHPLFFRCCLKLPLIILKKQNELLLLSHLMGNSEFRCYLQLEIPYITKNCHKGNSS